jgi:poly(beta-D-mannuronate) lyase
MDNAILKYVPIKDGSFSRFTTGNSNSDWTTYEGAGIGQVQYSSNSATSNNGSARFKYNNGTEIGTPRLTQVLSGLQPDTEYTLSMYALEKNNSPISVTMGVYAGETAAVHASKIVDYAALVTAGAPQGDDSFRQDKLTFNSGTNTTLTLFIEYNANTVIADGGSDIDTEFRVDEVTLSYQGEPAPGSVTLFDSFRLVSHAQLNE